MPAIRILRDNAGAYAVVERERLEQVDGQWVVRLSSYDESWLPVDLARLHQARCFAEPGCFTKKA